MATSTHEIIIYRGDSYPLSFTIKNKSSGEVLDLTGYSFLLTVNTERDPLDESTQLFQLVGVVDAPTTGVVVFTPSSIDTDQVIGKYYYDVQMIDAEGNIRTIVKSTFSVTMDITK